MFSSRGRNEENKTGKLSKANICIVVGRARDKRKKENERMDFITKGDTEFE